MLFLRERCTDPLMVSNKMCIRDEFTQLLLDNNIVAQLCLILNNNIVAQLCLILVSLRIIYGKIYNFCIILSKRQVSSFFESLFRDIKDNCYFLFNYINYYYFILPSS